MLKRVYRYALDVIQPFPLSEEDSIEDEEGDLDDLNDVCCFKFDFGVSSNMSL